ncbi:MAG: tRNA pseudouridine(55) synthase TruB [Clostridiales bacterium]|jgi:tRNA pseudouridine55 synthase|nr:tRNA pseudouridine(55) synthase TruB [Clostridiales bacterium]
MNGFINIYKPVGMTSSDVVVRVRRRLREFTGKNIKVGHMGTLDPAAEGVLVVAVGTAAKLFGYFTEKRKVYTAEFTFGESTDTLDGEGKITASGKRQPSAGELAFAAAKLTGETLQTPPLYSAKSIGGKRAYELARKGGIFEIPPKKVVIYGISVLAFDGKRAVVRVECGGGVYIRSIARDMAELCETAAYMSALKRERAGEFGIGDAVGLDEFMNGCEARILPAEYILEDLPRADMDAAYLEKLKNGVRLKVGVMPEGNFKVYCGGALFGIGEERNGELIIKTRL